MVHVRWDCNRTQYMVIWPRFYGPFAPEGWTPGRRIAPPPRMAGAPSMTAARGPRPDRISRAAAGSEWIYVRAIAAWPSVWASNS